MTAVPVPDDPGPDSVMILSEQEWADAAHIARRYLHDTAYVLHSFPRREAERLPRAPSVMEIYRRRDLAERICRAVDQ